MSRARSLLFAVVLGTSTFAGLLAASRSALAAPADEKAARALFKDGNTLLESGDFVGALDKFRAAYARWPNVKILLNMAAALRKLGRFAEAADTYAQWLADPTADPARRDEVTTLLGELDAKLARIRIPVSEPPRRVTVDGRALPDETRELRVDPGAHVVIGEAPGSAPIVLKLELAAGESKDLEWIVPPAGLHPGEPADPVSPLDEVAPPDETLALAAARAERPRLTARTWPTALTQRPVVLPHGMLDVRADVYLGMSPAYSYGRPSALAPQIFYGLTDALSVGVTHRYGLCWGNDADGCLKTYDDFTLDSLLSFWRGPGGNNAALHAGIEFAQLDPLLWLGLELGARAHFAKGRLGAVVDPRLRIGLTAREEAGFREAVTLPLDLEVQVTPRLALTAQSQLSGPLDQFGDYYAFAAGGGLMFALSPRFDASVRLRFDNLKADSAYRTFELLLGFRL